LSKKLAITFFLKLLWCSLLIIEQYKIYFVCIVAVLMINISLPL